MHALMLIKQKQQLAKMLIRSWTLKSTATLQKFKSNWTLKTAKTKHKMLPSKQTAKLSLLTKTQSKLTLMQSKQTKQKQMSNINIWTAVLKTTLLTSIKTKLLSRTKQQLAKMLIRSWTLKSTATLQKFKSNWTLKTAKTKHKMLPSKQTAKLSLLTKTQSKLTLMQSKQTKQKQMSNINIWTAVSKTIPLTSIKTKLLSKTK